MLSYEYDAAGNVTLMTDYHDNETAYTYTDRNQLSTLTAPGSKVWSFDYNELGQPTDYDIPNGMTCNYGYDTKNRLTAIEYKDGTTVLDGFYYELDDTGNITKTTDELGGYWDYQYDDRYRLTDAVLTRNAGVRWSEEYTYDDGDNMLTKRQPWSNLFNDGTMSDWTIGAGSWSVTNDALHEPYSGAANWYVYKNQPEDDIYLWFSYKGNTSYNGTGLDAWVRRSSNGANRVVVGFKTNGTAEIKQANGGGTTVLASCSTAYANGTWYDVCIKVNGTNIEVWKGLRGGALTQIMTYSGLAVTASDTLMFQGGFYSTFDLDDMAVVKANGDPVETVTYAVNNANELSTRTDPNGTTTFGFDDWGRMTTKARGGYSATYEYRYEVAMCELASSFPGELSISNEFDAMQSQRHESINGNTSVYRWAGNELLTEETINGTLSKTYNGLSDVSGTDLASGSYRYYMFALTDSVSRIRSQIKAVLCRSDQTPFGGISGVIGDPALYSYGGLKRRTGGTLDHGKYRAYLSESARWTIRDPLGMVDGTNMYGYCRSNPVNDTDPLGLATLTIKGNCKNPGDGFFYLPEDQRPPPLTPLPWPVPEQNPGGSPNPPKDITVDIDAIYMPSGRLKVPGGVRCTLSCGDNGAPTKLCCSSGNMGGGIERAFGGPEQWWPTNPSGNNGAPPKIPPQQPPRHNVPTARCYKP